SLLQGFHTDWPAWLGVDYRSASQPAEAVATTQAANGDVSALGETVLRAAQAMRGAPRFWGMPIIFNLPAVLIVVVITWVLVRGIRESSGFNTAMVVLKLVIIAIFVGVGVFFVKRENWQPFSPNGFHGIFSAAATIFFAYIGFDAVSTATEETKNPQRNL